MIKVLKRMRRTDWFFVLICAVLICGQVNLDLKLPDYMQNITQKVQSGASVHDVLVIGGKMLLCTLGSLCLTFIVGFFAARVAAGLSMRLRGLVFEKTLSFSMEEINKFSIASLITRSTNDITQIQLVVAFGLQAAVRAPVMAVWAIVKVSTKHWQFAIVTGVAVAFIVCVLIAVQLLAVPRFRRIQTLTDNLNRVTNENLRGLRVVRAYNAENYQGKKFETANSDLTNNNLFANRVMAIMGAGMNLITNGMPLGIYWIGTALINKAPVPDAAAMAAMVTTGAQPDRYLIFSEMVTFMSYSMQIVMSFMMLAMIFVFMPRVTVAAKRIAQVLDTKVRIADGAGAQPREDLRGEVEFKNVSFRYPDGGEDVLQNVSFTAKPGETVAFIGSTGSGKSTLVNLIPRFYDPSEGDVFLDGVNVRDYKQRDLRNRLGYVSQQAILFYGTIESNVAFGENGRPKPGLDAVKRAVRIAQAQEFVDELEDGYDAHVSQGGSNFSGGQKQRISIARAVCRDPEVYIFDDSFSALDYKTDRSLRSVLERETGSATKLIVAQRIGTIRDADKIIVLDEGRVVGVGKHRELLETCAVYKEIALSQLSKEELDA